MRRDPSHTTRHAGPHRSIHFLAVNDCQIVNRLASPSLVRCSIDSAACTARLDDITHGPLLLQPCVTASTFWMAIFLRFAILVRGPRHSSSNKWVSRKSVDR